MCKQNRVYAVKTENTDLVLYFLLSLYKSVLDTHPFHL